MGGSSRVVNLLFHGTGKQRTLTFKGLGKGQNGTEVRTVPCLCYILISSTLPILNGLNCDLTDDF